MLWDSTNSSSIFCLLLVVKASSLQKVVKMIEEVVVSWLEVMWIRWMRPNFVAHFVQLLKPWLCDAGSRTVTEKHWALSVDQCQLQASQFSMHLVHLLSILLRCNGFTRIQKVVVDQTGSSHQIVTMTFLVQVWLWEAFWCFFSVQPLSWLYYKIHFSSHITIQYKNGLLLHRIRDDISKWFFFYLHHPFIELFHLSNLLQMLNDHRMVNVEFFGNFSCSCKRISFNDPLSWSLSTSDGQSLRSSSWQNF